MTGSIHFTPRPKKIVESLLHIAHRGNFTRYQIVKFFYLADREHLRRYGRPITYDYYYAMENGPVASIAYDLIKGTETHGIKIDALPFELVQMGSHHGIANPKRAIDCNMFSKSDLKILDQIVEKYQDSSFKELWELTHKHRAYDSVWSKSASMSVPMAFDDFFEGMENEASIIDDLSFSARGM